MHRIQGIAGTVYEYLAMLRREGPHEWIFGESRDIAAMNFRFKSKSRPIDYSVACATSMQVYPPERTLTGPGLFYAYEPGHITAVLERLVPANMLLTVVSRTFEGKVSSSVSYLISLLVDWLVGWLVNGSVGQRVRELVGPFPPSMECTNKPRGENERKKE